MIRTEINTPEGHGYVVCVNEVESGESRSVCVSDDEAGDVVIPLGVFRTMAKIVEASI